ncbi:ABC transporter substrate-binding protein [Paenibacillus marchantiophytorum]|uniref:ABC transporter substrate-binding protein n=1 Tax=Paenibacillus marchantiophytorum TaxID=1619310 RepID=A0ABQ1F3X8_9BACL|nr:ABC transporter substrate-binding protein [Paenibacillus marchantiophytorum]GFZ98511.1 ABC transporter substrate-binding protein [Paenibacillus marchantiophytorum]
MAKSIFRSLSVILLATVVTACASNAEPSGTSNSATGGAPAAINSNIKDGTIPASDKSKNPKAALSRTDTFIVGLTSAPDGKYNPLLGAYWNQNVNELVFSSLVAIDKAGLPVPALADKWEISNDGLQYTFHLRPDLKFSDGSPLTAEDAAFSLTVLHDPTYDGPTDITQAYIKGGTEYKKGAATSIEGIKVIDPLTLQVQTTQSSALALRLIGGYVIPKAYYGPKYKKGDLLAFKELNAKPLGAGLYTFDKEVKGQEIRLVANQLYYKGKPQIQNWIYKIVNEATALQNLAAGEIDYIAFTTSNTDIADQLKLLSFVDVNTYTTNQFAYLDFNTKSPVLQDKNVRIALQYGLDRQKFVDILYQGYGEVGNHPVAPTSWAYPKDVKGAAFDAKKAKELLDQAGWKVGAGGIREKDGKKLTVRYLSRDSNFDKVLIPILKENYTDIGVDVQFETLDYNAVVAKRNKGEFELAYFFYSTNDPYDQLRTYYSKSPEVPEARKYTNEKVDQLIVQSTSILDQNKRLPLLKDLYQELTNDPPTFILAYYKVLSATNSRIKGIVPNTYQGIVNQIDSLNYKIDK